MDNLMFIGVDPAPSKNTVIVYGNGDEEPKCKSLPPGKVREWLEQQPRRRLVAWDAPLSFSASFGHSDRPVDKAVRAFVAQQVKDRCLTAGAVSALPFSGCSHWAITCEVLGRPFGRPDDYEMPSSPNDLAGDGPFVIEVHPAVTVALWWLADGQTGPLVRYKPGGGLSVQAAADNRRSLSPFLRSRMNLPERLFDNDDTLDAAVAWTMARHFAAGSAVWLGDPQAGGFVLPSREVEQFKLQDRVEAVRKGWR